MDPMKTTGGALAGIAVVLLVLVQFLPWATIVIEGGSFGFGSFPDSEVDANTYDMEFSSGGDSSDEGWYSDDFDDEDGVGQIRASIPILVVGMVAALIATILLLALRGPAGPIVTLVSALILITGTVLYITGINAFFDDADFDWGASFYLAIIACALLVGAGVLGLVAGNRRPSA